MHLLRLGKSILNEDLSHDVSKKLKSCFPSLTIKDSHEDPAGAIHELVEQVQQDSIDFFIWWIDDLESIPEGLDYFYLPNVQAALFYRSGHRPLDLIKSFFAPPVHFAGAGPGKPGWLTVEAKQQMDEADICFYDALVNPQIIASLPSHVERFYVGKRGDSKSFDQLKINQLIAEHARKGQKVIRLKGGDSGILGRIAEEIDELNEHGVSYSITPGISAMQGLASQMGVLLTQRGISDRVSFTTARKAGGDLTQVLHFNESTLVIYMGILNLDSVCQQLLDSGYDKDLPAAIALNISRNQERFVRATLSTLADKVKRMNLRPPGLLVFGNVVDEKSIKVPAFSPLNGRKILLSSNNPQALDVAKEIRRWGGEPVYLYESMLRVNNELILPEYDDIILFTAEEVSHFYEIITKNNAPMKELILALDESVETTIECLFRHKSILCQKKDAVSIVSTLREVLINKELSH